MVEPSHRQARANVIVLLLVAVVSGLVVAAVYEVRGRAPKRHAEQRSDDDAPRASGPRARDDDPGASRGGGCAELRQRLLAQCPGDVPVAPTAAPQAPPTESRRDEARAVSELAVWLNPPPEELGDMAKRCEVRFDMPAITENQPPAVTDEASAALSLSGRERALVDQTLSDMHAGLRDFAKRAFAEIAGPSAAASAPTLEEMLTDLQTRPDGGFEEAREKLAAERAGLRPPPPRGDRQPAGERLLRRWASQGDEFERLLADKLGNDRARQLRVSTHAGWMNRFSQAGCRSQPQAASR